MGGATADLLGSEASRTPLSFGLGPTALGVVNNSELSTDPEIRFRYEIAMADQKGLSDDNGTSSTRALASTSFDFDAESRMSGAIVGRDFGDNEDVSCCCIGTING
ncbi:hypothetical protein Sjap_026403 [Stephania japonica]|uniref:Uncharacterized protein n=1 Tax=Stephania japonica TaxID=461633 RepID=A0AAP0HIG5_9MAGN